MKLCNHEIISKEEYIESLKESPAGSLEYLIKKLDQIPDQIRSAKTAKDTADIIETLSFIREDVLKELIEDLRYTEVFQKISLPDLLDLDQAGLLWFS